MQELTIIQASDQDAERLANIRVDAMKPSLEAIGRYDPDRARNRFLEGFSSKETFLVHLADELVGFYVLRNRTDHLYLDHLYIRP